MSDRRPRRQAWERMTPRPRAVAAAPLAFEGTLQELFDQHIRQVLPEPRVVAAFHERLVAYIEGPSPLLYVRQLKGLQRGVEKDVRGHRVMPTDNSPAWMVHRLLFDGWVADSDEGFQHTLEELIAAHMFELAGIPTVNQSGWHVAHILPARDGDTDWPHWSRATLVARFVRNLNPCNCFYLPLTGWQAFGASPDVLAFAAQVYRERYGRTWSEFIALARGIDLDPPAVQPSVLRYAFSPTVTPDAPAPARAVPRPRSSRMRRTVTRAPDGVVEYPATRLLFIRHVVDGLDPHDAFRILTRDDGVFQFTREQFERVFPNVLLTDSWRIRGEYHFPSVPTRAMPFRVEPSRIASRAARTPATRAEIRGLAKRGQNHG